MPFPAATPCSAPTLHMLYSKFKRPLACQVNDLYNYDVSVGCITAQSPCGGVHLHVDLIFNVRCQDGAMSCYMAVLCGAPLWASPATPVELLRSLWSPADTGYAGTQQFLQEACEYSTVLTTLSMDNTVHMHTR